MPYGRPRVSCLEYLVCNLLQRALVAVFFYIIGMYEVV